MRMSKLDLVDVIVVLIRGEHVQSSCSKRNHQVHYLDLLKGGSTISYISMGLYTYITISG